MSKIYPYAGFWKRAIAFVIDGIILSVPMALFSLLAVGTQVFSFIKLVSTNAAPSPDMLLPVFGKWMLGIIAIWVFNVVLLWLYYALMESGKHKATWGKMALGIKVVDSQGQRISFARATGRTFGKFISHMVLYFGDYMAGFTQHRQALHDLMAATYVVDKNYQQGQELPTLPFSKGGLIASLLAALGPILLYIVAIVAMMLLTISDLKEDPNTQKVQITQPNQGNVVKFQFLGVESEDGQEVPFKIIDTDGEESKLDDMITAADTELYFLSPDTPFPFTKENVEYNQNPQGYTATWKDSRQNEYVLLRKPGEGSCWLKVPEDFDLRFSIPKPCK